MIGLKVHDITYLHYSRLGTEQNKDKNHPFESQKVVIHMMGIQRKYFRAIDKLLQVKIRIKQLLKTVITYNLKQFAKKTDNSTKLNIYTN